MSGVNEVAGRGVQSAVAATKSPAIESYGFAKSTMSPRSFDQDELTSDAFEWFDRTDRFDIYEKYWRLEGIDKFDRDQRSERTDTAHTFLHEHWF